MMNADTHTATAPALSPSAEGNSTTDIRCTTAIPWLIVTARAGASINNAVLLETDDELRPRWSWRDDRLADGKRAVLIPRRWTCWR